MTSVRSMCTLAAAVAVSVTGFAHDGNAQAKDPQELSKTTTVLTRPRPETDPLGIRMGAFTLRPKADVSLVHDDNIYRAQTGEVDDVITIVAPSVSLASDWNRHRMGVTVGATIGRYLDEESEDYEDYNLRLDGQVDITRRSNVSGNLGYQKLHEDRGSPDDANGVSPTEYTLKTFEAKFFQGFNRVGVQVGATFNQYDYDDTATSSGTVVNEDDRDRDEKSAFVRLGYEITPSYEAFVRAKINQVDYDLATDDNGFNRDSDGYEFNGGVRLDLGGVAFGDVFVGYLAQNYDDANLSDIKGVSYGAGVSWNATQLTTVRLDLSRTVAETTQTGVSGTLNKSISVSVDHELRRSVLIGAKAGVRNSEFHGTTREDDILSGTAYVKYMMSRFLYIRASYDYSDRDSTAANSDYTDNRFMLRVEGQF